MLVSERKALYMLSKTNATEESLIPGPHLVICHSEGATRSTRISLMLGKKIFFKMSMETTAIEESQV
jgi:hypothetical protein